MTLILWRYDSPSTTQIQLGASAEITWREYEKVAISYEWNGHDIKETKIDLSSARKIELIP